MFVFLFDLKNVKEDVLSRFIAESEKNPETMTDQYLRDTMFGFLVAGKDTTANTLSWFFYMLCKNPLIQEKVSQEVIDITCSKENDDANFDDFMATITDETLENMHYLHATLSETLRLYPAVPMVNLLKHFIIFFFMLIILYFYVHYSLYYINIYIYILLIYLGHFSKYLYGIETSKLEYLQC